MFFSLEISEKRALFKVEKTDENTSYMGEGVLGPQTTGFLDGGPRGDLGWGLLMEVPGNE